MAPVIFAGSDRPGVSVPRVNFVAIAILLASVGAVRCTRGRQPATWCGQPQSSRPASCWRRRRASPSNGSAQSC